MALHSLAQIAALRQETSAAEPLFERALRLLEPVPPELVDVLFDYGGLLNQKRLFEKAQQVYKRGMTVTEQIFGADHPKVKAFQQQLVLTAPTYVPQPYKKFFFSFFEFFHVILSHSTVCSAFRLTPSNYCSSLRWRSTAKAKAKDFARQREVTTHRKQCDLSAARGL